MSVERFDRDLADVLREIAGEEAPMSLRFRLSDITERAPLGQRLWFATPMRLSMVAAAAVAVLALAILFLPRETIGPSPSESPSAAPPSAESTQTVAPTPAPSVVPTSVPTLEPTTMPEPTAEPSAEWSGLMWSDPVTPSFTVHLNDLLPWRDGYVAVGEVPIDATRSEAAFLSSSDGLNWAVEDLVDPGLDRFPQHLVRLGDELLAFSHPSIDMLPMAGSTIPLIWQSNDGASWSLLDSQSWRDAWRGLVVGHMPASWDTIQYDPTTGLVDVASGPQGLVAIGNSFTAGDMDGMVPAVVYSADGRSWSRGSLPDDSPSAIVNSVASRGVGFVTVGAVNVGPQPGTAVPAAWYSTDGLTWTRATVQDVPSLARGLHGEFGPLVAGSDGLVTCLSSREMGAGGWRFMYPWISTDGTTWGEASVDLANRVPLCGWTASDGNRIVALGGRPAPTGQPWPGVTGAWLSSDGATWEPLTLSATLTDMLERFWVVPDGVIYAGEQSFRFGVAVGE